MLSHSRKRCGGSIHLPLSILLLIFFLPTLFLTGCSSEEDPSTYVPRVEIYQVPDNVPVPGVKVVVVDRQTFTPVTAPVLSNEKGISEFPGLERGNYRLVAFGGAHYQVIGLPTEWNQDYQAPNKNEPSPFSPEKDAPISIPPQVLVAPYAQPGDLPRIQGQVVDAVSGQPLTAAFVSTSPFLGGYSGQTTVQDDVTLSDGRFLVSEIAFGMDPRTQNYFQIEPLLVSCAGYLPRSWVHVMTSGDDNLDISGVVIALEPMGAQPTGSLSGRLLLDDAPAEGVEVGLGGRTPDKSAVGQPGWVTITDAEGEFHFPQLPEGVYFVHAGFRRNDGFFFPNQPENVGRTIVADQETQTGDLTLLHEIDLYYPPNGWQYLGAQWLEPFQWNLVPGASSYLVYLDRGILGETTETTFPIPEDLELSPGSHVWAINALDDQGEIIGTSERHGTFYIIDPEN